MIELDHVSKAYHSHAGTKVILDNVSMAMPSGVNIGVLGRNGAGKSTLMRIISGAEMPDHGEVRKHGKRVSWPLGFAGGFNGSLTGEENARFVARIYQQDIDPVLDFTLTFSELGEYFYEPISRYSSGMKSRLAFALSMAIDFDVYLIDEVTAVGDKPFQQKCRIAFDERKERSQLFVVSHSAGTIKSLCQQCAVLHQGQLTMYEDIDLAFARYDDYCRMPS